MHYFPFKPNFFVYLRLGKAVFRNISSSFEWVMASITRFLEKNLKLKVNIHYTPQGGSEQSAAPHARWL
jgi:hypothetical protein